ncbi:MAG TPA: thiamine pyrophosphate-binding protein [Pseudonocardia sp.]|nr:thiamine pyrophosphate-binding protein [Pseudonocardia sp.]
MHGGDVVAEILRAQGTRFLFTLCGGHISPILVSAKDRGIRVVDTRHEATAVFAADAVARLTGRPGVAAVTAGPGVTNTVTAVKNAQLAQSPVVLLGGAAPTVLQGRGALQDIDQMALMGPHVKAATRVRRVVDVGPAVEAAFRAAREGVPGPVFVELPIDLLYDEALVRSWYGAARGGRTLAERAVKAYLSLRVRRMFSGAGEPVAAVPVEVAVPAPDAAAVATAAERLAAAARPVVLVGSQALVEAGSGKRVAAALERIGAPVYLSGMARGLLGRDHPLQARHKRRDALREADLVVLAGVPADFRLDYGNHIPRRATHVSLNRSRADLRRNRRPDVAVLGDAGLALEGIADGLPDEPRWAEWHRALAARDAAREAEIDAQAQAPTENVNPVRMCREVAAALPPGAVVVGDGGDIVATASYTVAPDGPLRWLDPGAFGTLGVGAGFALGAKLVYPDAPVWIVFGDGSVGYSLAEFDTFVRHDLPVVAVVGNDAAWSQIAREQVEMLGDDVGTVLAPTRYDRVVEGFGALGLHVDDPAGLADALRTARATTDRPVLVDVAIGRSDFRKGSISM